VVDLAADGEEGLWLAETSEYDAIVLDLMLPKMDGLTLLRRLREQGSKVNVLILTAKDSIEDRVEGLQAGADDYLIKPFAFAELLARVQTLVRRHYGAKSPHITVGDLMVDTARREASLAGKALDLPPREYDLLEYLVLRRGEVVTRTEIEHRIYDERVEPASNVVDSAICTLRKKIDLPGKPSLIRTRRGIGYTLKGPE
jgi:DNA-binding response OmpR family regulator